MLGHYESVFELSPAAYHAQRMQELKDLADYRQRRNLAYREWSKPEALAERKRRHEATAAAALELGRQLSEIARKQQAEKAERPKLAGITVTPIVKPAPLTRWQRLRAWIAMLLRR
jgi:hypothetical protein